MVLLSPGALVRRRYYVPSVRVPGGRMARAPSEGSTSPLRVCRSMNDGDGINCDT